MTNYLAILSYPRHGVPQLTLNRPETMNIMMPEILVFSEKRAPVWSGA
jgi:enoyl-CoA hydratase/carnithine racemase